MSASDDGTGDDWLDWEDWEPECEREAECDSVSCASGELGDAGETGETEEEGTGAALQWPFATSAVLAAIPLAPFTAEF